MKIHRIFAMIGILLFLPILCIPALATGNDGALNLRCKTSYNGQQIFFTGDEYTVVRIADAHVENVNGADTIRYTTLPDYQQYDCDWGNLSANQLHEKAIMLSSVAVQNGSYDAVSTIDAQGHAVFADLAPAYYLVMRTSTVDGHDKFAIDPFLVSIPMEFEGDINFSITATPKFDGTPIVPVAPHLPQTGQLNWPIPILLVSGAILILWGLKQYKRNQQDLVD